ncbi:hypothetical protein LU604_22090 [Erwinia tracheiphila]|uniref:hypothetical protein n=1 Tax=Erwinia tracheiphila TaxID=65700 RepID=UPI001F328B9A|nr:hypothetical protein [Erwinia tracheiphila]UIA83044.1 hypothetical protein LU604_22090 [Erwinia tracheiphila]UIA91622.1 hypothetical protein LU632_21550 [Erwinia tracheiphila]
MENMPGYDGKISGARSEKCPLLPVIRHNRHFYFFLPTKATVVKTDYNSKSSDDLPAA